MVSLVLMGVTVLGRAIHRYLTPFLLALISSIHVASVDIKQHQRMNRL